MKNNTYCKTSLFVKREVSGIKVKGRCRRVKNCFCTFCYSQRQLYNFLLRVKIFLYLMSGNFVPVLMVATDVELIGIIFVQVRLWKEKEPLNDLFRNTVQLKYSAFLGCRSHLHCKVYMSNFYLYWWRKTVGSSLRIMSDILNTIIAINYDILFDIKNILFATS